MNIWIWDWAFLKTIITKIDSAFARDSIATLKYNYIYIFT
jgi:hypothetical protein